MERRKITLIPGDGIGPEIVEAVQDILEASGAPLDWETADAGLSAVKRHKTPIPDDTLESIKRNKVALKGPTTTPVGGGHKSVNVTIRKSLELFANVRPAVSLPSVQTRFSDIDLIVVRENIEDTYGGIEHWQTPEVAQCLRIITRPGSLGVNRYALEMAKAMGRDKVTCVHKANIQKMTDGLFLETFRELAPEYPELECDDILIDNLCMQLVSNPEQFDVLVLPNLFGDIVSDLCAGLVGGLGVAPSANIGNDRAVFEAVHGSAPDIAGQGVANPTALLLSAIQMLHYLGLHDYANDVDTALRMALLSGIRTRDLGGHATTLEFTRVVINALPRRERYPKSHASHQGKSPRMPKVADEETAAAEPQEWKVVGVDVFTRGKGIDKLPKQVGPLELIMVSNRGTKMYPGPVPDILMVDWYRCRYLADEDVSDQQIQDLLDKVSQAYEWMHVEKLHVSNGQQMFSRAQGE
ncbi:MAG TPA: isocitrate/isopropylmalate family dehydrogenase [Acidobacteriota bacterium]|nr:isocitrate/isopropylmalate family dehydrogenase [Acidobacteriota bacterium]